MSKPAQERRYHRAAELRASDDETGKPPTLVGMAVVYNSPSEDLGGFTEIIEPGAFTESLKTADVRALIDHNSTLLIGRTASKTLRLIDGRDGLRAEIDPPDTSYGRDLIVTVRPGDHSGMSFGFIALQDRWVNKEGRSIRYVTKADIFDVSVVTYPAFPETSIALRSLEAWRTASPAFDPDEHRRLKLRINESCFRS